MTAARKPALAGIAALFLWVWAGAAFAAVGQFQFVSGNVKIVDPKGQERPARKGGDVNQGDTILTAPGASAQIRMIDQGLIALRPDTRLRVDTYIYKGREDGSEKGILSLLKGGFRTITGIIGRLHKQNYTVHTPTATIGIRGTDHEPMYIPQPAPGEKAIGEPGTYDKVNVGAAFIQTPLGSVDIGPNKVGFAPPNAPPVILPTIPGFFKSTPPVQQGQAGQPPEKQEGLRAEASSDTTAKPEGPRPETSKKADVAENLPPVNQGSLPITGSDTSLKVDLTKQTLAASTGAPVAIEKGAFAVQAQAAAAAAQAAATAAASAVSAISSLITQANSDATSTAAISTIATTSASTAISNANSAFSSANIAVTNAAALSINTGLASANAASSASVTTAATNFFNSATSAFNASGSLADATIAVPAKSAMDSAFNALIAANTAVQNAASTAATENSNLSAAIAAANSALAAANGNLIDANSFLTTANNQNSAISSAASAASNAASSVSAQLSPAQAAASAAQAAAAAAQQAANQAAAFQSQGDFTNAQAQLNIALQKLQEAATAAASAAAALAAAQSAVSTAAAQLAAAQSAQSAASSAVANAISSANSAQSNAGLASSQAAAAQTAKSNGDAAVSTTASQLAVVGSNNSIIATQAPLVAYHNPAPGVTSDKFSHGVLAVKAVTGGVENQVFDLETVPSKTHTKYVFDGAQNLVEIRSTSYLASGFNYSPAPSFIADADIKFSGGTAKDTLLFADNSLYLGRWQGGAIDVTDNAGVVSPFSIALGPTSAHWGVVSLAPSPYSYTLSGGSPVAVERPQTLIGTASYHLVGATHPTDSFGNVGTLGSASLTADFSKQTLGLILDMGFVNNPTDPVAPSSRSFSLNANASNVPIKLNEFSTKHPGANLSISCTGPDCASAGYQGEVQGSIAGNNSQTIGLSYGFTPNISSPPPNRPFADFIQGVAAFSSTPALPTQGVIATSVSSGKFRQLILTPIDVGSGLVDLASGSSLSGTTTTSTNTNFLFDGSGNLVRVQDAPYSVFERGTSVSFAPAPLSDAAVSLSGATPGAEGIYNDSANGIRLGRWQGGTVTVRDLSGMNPDYYIPVGLRSVVWAVRELPLAIPLSGSFDYTPVYHTTPTDSLGNSGALNYAQLTANFTTQTVNPAVSVSINSQNLTAAASSVPIGLNFGFNVSSDPADNVNTLQVLCSGPNCAPSPSAGGRPYGGRIVGGFAGPGGDAAGAFFRYTFNTRFDPANPSDITLAGGRPVNDYITGLVGFAKGTAVNQPSVSTLGAVVTSYFTGTFALTDSFQVNDYAPAPGGVTTDGSGNLLSVSDDPAELNPQQASISGGTAVGPTQATHFAATGIKFGRWAGQGADSSGIAATVSGTDFLGLFNRNVLGSYHWVYGPAAAPFYLSQALTGVATYTFDGGTLPTDQNNATGTVNSASLSVDFTRQAVNFGLQVTVPPAGTSGNRVWNASATNIRLEGGGGFNADTGSGAPYQTLAVSLNTTGAASGSINGQLTGLGLTGAGVNYAFAGNDPNNAFSHEHVNGALAFALSSFQPQKGDGTNNGSQVSGINSINPDTAAYGLGLVASGLSGAGAIEDRFNHKVTGAANSANRVSFDNNGIPVKFDGEAFSVVNAPACSPNPCFVASQPARFSIVSGGATASLQEFGRDPATGISWGRYGGGSIAVFDRVSSASSPTLIGTQDLTSQNWHGVFSPIQDGPTVLPISGTFTYTKVGNTNPTDNLGHVGVLNSASLTANFTTRTVDASINATVNSNIWAASASGMPIQQNTFFQAEKTLSGAGTTPPLTVTVNGLSTNTAGSLKGGFTGTSGQGAAIAYSLNQGGNGGTTVSGVAAFKR